MSLYHETADLLTAPSNAGGSLKSRIFSKKELKNPPAQLYALAIEACKWSPVLKEVVEKADILRLERKVCSPTSQMRFTFNFDSVVDTSLINTSGSRFAAC